MTQTDSMVDRALRSARGRCRDCARWQVVRVGAEEHERCVRLPIPHPMPARGYCSEFSRRGDAEMTELTRGRCEACDHYKEAENTGRWCAHWCRNANVCPPDGRCHAFAQGGSRWPAAWTFAFPPNRRRGSVYDQLKHASGEVVEATAAMCGDSLGCAVEVMDAIECLEGALRALEAERPGITDEAFEAHRAKNSARGDY